HNRDVAQFNKNALMVHGSQTLKGDSLYYDRKRGIGRTFNNVEAVDSTQSALLLGNFGEYHEKTERTIMTNQAQFIQIQDKDSLYLHADTIMSIKDSLITKTDSSYFSIIKAFHKVKIFKSDFQAKCDSLVYNLLDSTIELHRLPVMWSGKNQITAKFIKIFTENQEVTEVRMYENSLIVAKSDTIRFDQVRGENMIAYVDSGKLTRIEVKKDGATIYIAKEKEKLMGVNKITCVDMTIYMANNELDRIKFYQTPDGTLYPPYYLKEEELKFDNFQWNENLRPKSKEDIFIWIVQEETNSDAKGKDKKTKSSDKSTKRSDMETDRPARLNKGKK
ncbi:MAG: OstA-like protein, partial [Bacteroidales bacterium]|nr:OstA-like protein [Bacteroidales bacterium]